MPDTDFPSSDVATRCDVSGLDELACWLAIEFPEGRRDFTFCDSAANNVMPLAEWNLTDSAGPFSTHSTMASSTIRRAGERSIRTSCRKVHQTDVAAGVGGGFNRSMQHLESA
jgi:hypothetical protein